MTKYTIESTDKKVYVHTKDGCTARLCNLSAEFYGDTLTTIPNCSNEQFQEEARKRGYEIPEKFRPESFKC
jgi:hypothetical protein